MNLVTEPMVLVVEDDEIIREIVCDVLGEDGFDVICAATTAGALAALDSDARIAAAFIDVDLGDRGGGYIVARHARKTRPGVAVVYTSGGARGDFAQERVKNSLFVQKPYLPSRIPALLHDVLSAGAVAH